MNLSGWWIVLAVVVLIVLVVPLVGWGMMASGTMGPEWCHWSGV